MLEARWVLYFFYGLSKSLVNGKAPDSDIMANKTCIPSVKNSQVSELGEANI